MSDGEVRGNTSSNGGVSGSGIFTMSGGVVSGNSGGGVSVGTFTMSGGEVSGNTLSGTETYGREVTVAETFKIFGDAWPERVSLSYNYNNPFIIISGPLSGGTVTIDISGSPSGWINRQILKLDSSYVFGDLASLTGCFTLGNFKQTNSPYTEEAITGYRISGNGYFVAE
jgi:hypothetical protein